MLSAPLSVSQYKKIQASLLQLQTALSFVTYQELIYPVYVSLIRHLIDANPANMSAERLAEFFAISYPVSRVSDTMSATAGSVFLTGINTVDDVLAPYAKDPVAYGLHRRHQDILQGIRLINGVMQKQLAPHFITDDYGIIDTQYLEDNIATLAKEIDKDKFVHLWNRFVSNIPVNKQPTPEFSAVLSEFTAFLMDYLTYDGKITPAGAAKFHQLYQRLQNKCQPLKDAQYYFLCSQIADASMQAASVFTPQQLAVMNLIAKDNQAEPATVVVPRFSLPSRIENKAALLEVLAANESLHNNLAFVTALYNKCQHSPALQLLLINQTVREHQDLRRQFQIDDTRQSFNREITLDYWLHDLLIQYCKLSYDHGVNPALTELTRFTLNVDNENLTGIQKVYAVVDKITESGILDTELGLSLLPFVQMVPGLERLTHYNSKSVQKAAADFKQSIPFKYLHSSYQPAVYDIQQLSHFAAHCADKSIQEQCDQLSTKWQTLSSEEKVAAHDYVLKQYFANAPVAMINKFHPEGVPNDKMFLLTAWFTTSQQAFYQAQASHTQQAFHKPAPAVQPKPAPVRDKKLSAEKQWGRFRDAYKQVQASADADAVAKATERMRHEIMPPVKVF